jgi:hypothetical protein
LFAESPSVHVEIITVVAADFDEVAACVGVDLEIAAVMSSGWSLRAVLSDRFRNWSWFGFVRSRASLSVSTEHRCCTP